MRAAVLALIAVAACKQRGTISLPYIDPCGSAERVAVYLSRNFDCASLACGKLGFDCTEPTCRALCTTGYCTPDEAKALVIDPPSAGDFALVMVYQGPPADACPLIDEGYSCFALHVDADGTRSETVPVDANPEQGASSCCLTGSGC
jgi:hypothetical protein